MTTDTIGGVWTYCLELLRSLRLRGVKAGVATMGAPLSCEQSAELEEIGSVQIFESSYKLEWEDDCWTDVAKAGKWLIRLEKEFHPDIVHLNGFCHASLGWKAPVVCVAHSCVVSWWEAVKGETPPAKYDEYRLRVERGLQSADMVVAPTAAMLSRIWNLYGPFRRSSMIHNGCDVGSFHPSDKADIILSAGRLWDEAKNISLVQKAAAKLPWPVYVAGELEHPGGGTQGIENLTSLGKLSSEEIKHWFATSAIFALPARYEPFGLSILEAALSGCVLVLGKIDTLHEVWGSSATYVNPDAEEELHSALMFLIDNPGVRRRQGMESRIRALHYTSQRMASEYMHVYGRLLGKALGEESLGREFASMSVTQVGDEVSGGSGPMRKVIP